MIFHNYKTIMEELQNSLKPSDSKPIRLKPYKEGERGYV